MLCIAPLAAACVSTVRPPPAPAEPVTIYLVREARHEGLGLPDGAGSYVEYGYGDWDWYAQGKTRWYHLFDTVFWPTRGALMRRPLGVAGETGLSDVRPGVACIPVAVERARAEALGLELARRHAVAARTGNSRQAEDGAVFVPVAEDFWFGHNCHDAAARWLERLGCRVGWDAVRAGLSVVPEAEAD